MHQDSIESDEWLSLRDPARWRGRWQVHQWHLRRVYTLSVQHHPWHLYIEWLGASSLKSLILFQKGNWKIPMFNSRALNRKILQYRYSLGYWINYTAFILYSNPAINPIFIVTLFLLKLLLPFWPSAHQILFF